MNAHLTAVPAGLAAGALAAFLLSGSSAGFEQTRAAFFGSGAAMAKNGAGSPGSARAEVAGSNAGLEPGGDGKAPVTLAALRALIDRDSPVKTDARIYRLLESLPPETVAELAREAMLLPEEDRQRYLLIVPLQERWAKLAPADALTFAHSLGRSIPGLDKVAAKDPAEAERLYLSAPPAGRGDLAWQAVLRGLAERDPVAALARAAQNRPDGSAPGPTDAWAVYYQWSKKDPAAATAWLRERGTPEEKKSIAWSIAEVYAKTDPAAALKWVRGLELEPDGRERNILVKLAERDPAGALEQWRPGGGEPGGLDDVILAAARKDPAAALAALETRTAPGELRTFQTAIVAAMAESDPQAAKDYLPSITDDDARRSATALIAKALAREDSAAAARWYLEQPDASRGMAPMELIRSYTAKSPQEAMEWSLQLSGNDRLNTTRHVISEWAKTDSAAAVAAVREIADSQQRLEMTGRLASGWTESAPEQTLAWAKTLEGREKEAALLGAALSSWGEKTRSTGRQAVEELLRGGVLTPENVSQTVYAARQLSGMDDYNQISSRGGADWMVSLPPGTVREQALKEQIMNWSSRDSMTASRWVSDQPPGEVRDLGASELVKVIAPKDPASAFVWAADIGEPERRGRRLLETVQLWQKTNPDAAREAVETSTLSAPEKTRLLEALNP